MGDEQESVVDTSTVIQPGDVTCGEQQGETAEKADGKGRKGDMQTSEQQQETGEKVPGKCKKGRKKQKLAEGEAFEEWDWESMVKPVSYFRDEVKLPSKGAQVLSISPSKVTDQMLAETFGPRNASNGYTISKGKGFSVQDLKELNFLLDGKENPLNLCLTKSLAKGIYVDFILHEEVDWASYAHDKHRAQLKRHYDQRLNKPTGPPHVRELRVYRQTKVQQKPGSEDISKYLLPSEAHTKAEGPLDIAAKKRQPSNQFAGFTSMHSPKMNHASSSSKDPCEVSVVQSPSFPVFGQPLDVWMIHSAKDAIAHFKEKSVVTVKEQHDTNVSIGKWKESEGVAIQRRAEAQGHLKQALEEQQTVRKKIAELNEQKKQVLMDQEEAEDEGSDPDEDDMHHLKDLEEQLEGLTALIAEAETELQSAMFASSKWAVNKDAAASEVLQIEKQLTTLEADLSSHEADLELWESNLSCLKSELRLLTRVFEKSRIILVPKSIPTSVELRSKVFWLSKCPVCNLGFHCNNFMPTPCGHTYHPSCLIPLLSTTLEAPKCMACDQALHPDWLRAWGVPWQHPSVQQLAYDLGLEAQQIVNEADLTDLYTKHPALLLERREEQLALSQKLNVKWDKAQVDKDTNKTVASIVARNAEPKLSVPKSNGTDASGVSEPVGSRQKVYPSLSEDDRDVVAVKIEGGKVGRKRKSSVGDNKPRKLATRSMTEAVLATTDFSPTDRVQVVKQKKLESVKSPSKENTKSPKGRKSPGQKKSPKGSPPKNGSAKSTAKSNMKNNSSRRKLNIGG